MSEPLQPFGFKDSAYERVEQPYRCGRAADGEPCPMGPDRAGTCRGTFECVPARETDEAGTVSWRCTRLRRLGGACTVGPGEDGTCCHPRPPCRPKTSVRLRRNRATGLVAALTLGILMLVLFSEGGTELFSPGELSAAHDGIACADCHEAAARGPVHWPQLSSAEDGAERDAALCLRCHQFAEEEHLLDPHWLPPAKLAALTSKASAAGGSNRPLVDRIARFLSPGLPETGGTLACNVCHREHHGAGTDLTRISNDDCQVCHVRRFGTFAESHPEFGDYPHRHRSPIAFDHAAHFETHFPAANPDLLEGDGRNCVGCHVLGADGGTMPVRSYKQACAGCHTKEFDFEQKRLVFLVLPKLDRKLKIEGWTAKDGAGSTPTTSTLRIALADARDLIAKQPDFLKSIKLRGKQGRTEQAVGIGTAIMRAFQELGADPDAARAAFGARMGAFLGTRPSDAELKRLVPDELIALIGAARRNWFEGATDALPEPGPGAFFAEDYRIVYRPKGHADPLLTAWLPYLVRFHVATGDGAGAVLNEDLKSCFKCHNVDAEGDALHVRWDGRLPRRLAKFSHAPHLGWPALQTEKDWPGQNCANCHVFDGSTETKGRFFFSGNGVTDPNDSPSNFRSVEKRTCATCHNGSDESETCITCHRYHAPTPLPLRTPGSGRISGR